MAVRINYKLFGKMGDLSCYWERVPCEESLLRFNGQACLLVPCGTSEGVYRKCSGKDLEGE